MVKLQSIFPSRNRHIEKSLFFCAFFLVLQGCNEHDKKTSNAPHEPGAASKQPLPDSTQAKPDLPSAEEMEKKRAVLTKNATSLVADVLRGALTLEPPKNVTLAPNYLLAHTAKKQGPLSEPSKMPSTLRVQLPVSVHVDTLERRFVGLDGSTTSIPLCFLEFGVPTNTLETPEGIFEVFELPIKDAQLRFLLIHPPRLKAQALAKLVSQDLLAQLLKTPLNERTIPHFIRLPDVFQKPHQTVPALLKAANSPWAERAQTGALEALVIPAEYWGPRTGLRHLRSQNQIGRPTWYLVANQRDGGIEAFIALNVAPLPGSYTAGNSKNPTSTHSQGSE